VGKENVIMTSFLFLSSFHFSFHRLAGMKWKWAEFSVEEKKIMIERFAVFFREGTTLDLSSLLNAFHVVEYHWKEDDPVKLAIFTGIVRNLGQVKHRAISGKGVANLIFYLGKSAIPWKNIRKDVQDNLLNGISRCYKSLSEQETRNIFQG
jgi:hypothetical protein